MEILMQMEEPRVIDPAYLSDVDIAMKALARWKELARHTDLSPQALVCDVFAVALTTASGNERRGFIEAVTAYVLCAMEGGLPILGHWHAMHDLAPVGERPYD